ncbi:MAG: Macrolide export ATP-binding/permease protein MacB [Firmicutes bacterium]|nr:Macrolide export ATP-binding/permease protein MacB [Bacillota bacterium]
MKLLQAVKMAFTALYANKMRSLLTMLGVIIGVLSVIVIITLGRSATAEVMSQLEGLGASQLTVSIRGQRNVAVSRFESLEEREGIKEVLAVLSANTTVRAGSREKRLSVEGSLPSYENVRDAPVTAGRFLEQGDLNMRYRSAVVGLGIADEFFNTRDILGKRIMINGTDFMIVGVLEESAQFGGFGGGGMGGGPPGGMQARVGSPANEAEVQESDDDRIIIPLTTAQRLFKNSHARTFYVVADSPETVALAQWEVERFLLAELRDEENFSVFNPSELLSVLDQTMGTLTLMLAGIAAISLLVGGIGIMNIMLVSVTERTREIGIRKAIGAKRRDILAQFLVESGVVSGTGGVLGIILGFALTEILEGFMNFEISISVDVIILATAFSVGVGVLFGLYPAAKASKLRPIEALRHE